MAELFDFAPDVFLRVGVEGRVGLRRAPGRDGLPFLAGDDPFLLVGLDPPRDGLAGDLPLDGLRVGDVLPGDFEVRVGDLPPGLLADLGGDWRPETPDPGRAAAGDAGRVDGAPGRLG